MNEDEVREQMAIHGRSLFERGLTSGSSGNMSVRREDGILLTPTNCCLGRLDPKRISKIDSCGRLLSGDRPSKEAFLHLAMYRCRPHDQAIVHLHSTYSVAVSCLADIDPTDVLPPITAYYVMRVGRLPLIAYYPPGDLALADEVEKVARTSRAVLLANHGPVVSAADLDTAVYAMEELEETAKLHLLLRDKPTRLLTAEQCQSLRRQFPA
jgi:ribulose-5-phosphate 4-epimerase/fuculose-1-phosphate aldolase